MRPVHSTLEADASRPTQGGSMSRIWWAAVAALALTLALFAGPAAALEVGEEYTGPVEPGDTLTLLCPPGEMVQLESRYGGYATVAYFWRNKNMLPQAQVASYASGQGTTPITDSTGLVVGLSYTVPKTARWTFAWVTCEPVSVLTTTITLVGGFTAGEAVVVPCPTDFPWVVSAEVIGDADGDLSTQQDQYLITYEVVATPGQPHGTAIQFVGPEGDTWQATLTCSLT
jgi:hypothetical protein